MKIGSDCGGPCKECIAHFGSGCLAGHGDDDFTQATIESLEYLLGLDLTFPYNENQIKKMKDKIEELKSRKK